MEGGGCTPRGPSALWGAWGSGHAQVPLVFELIQPGAPEFTVLPGQGEGLSEAPGFLSLE